MTEPHRCGPGLYDDMSAAEYHADPCVEPSLSASLAKILYWKTPRHAWLRHPRLNPKFEPARDDKFNLGTAVHESLLRPDNPFVRITGFADYRKDAAKEKRDTALDAGLIPLLDKEAIVVNDMTGEIKVQLAEHEIELVHNENVLVWRENGNITCRAMLDSHDGAGHIYDLKTTSINLANDKAVARLIASMDYDLSASFYVRGMEQTFPDLSGRIKFSWLFVDADEPYGLRRIDADNVTLEYGRRKMARAMNQWAHCVFHDNWPRYQGLSRTVHYAPWAENEILEREIAMEEQGS